MKKTWSDERIIKYMEKTTGLKNGIVSRDDDGYPEAYISREDNGDVYALLFEENSNDMSYYKL